MIDHDTCKMLLSNGLRTRNFERFEKAVNNGVDLLSPVGLHDEMPIELLVSKNDLSEEQLKKYLEIFLSKGIDLNTTNSNGQTAIHYLFKKYAGLVSVYSHMNPEKSAGYIRKFIDHIKLLLSLGADLNVRDSNGFTPMAWTLSTVVCHNYKDLLVEAVFLGANPSIKDNLGRDCYAIQDEMPGLGIEEMEEILGLSAARQYRQNAIITMMKGTKSPGSTLAKMPIELLKEIIPNTENHDWLNTAKRLKR